MTDDHRLRTVETQVAVIERTIEEREKALIVATGGMKDKLEAMNEFRGQLKDQASTFISRPEHETLSMQVNIMAARVSGLESKVYLGGMGILIVVSVLQLVLNYVHR